MGGFKSFILNEEKNYLGHQVGDVLTGLQDLQGDMPNLGARYLAKLAEEIVNQIRKILHSRWSPKYQPQLLHLQRVAVAIQKAIEERGDLKTIIPSALQSLQQLSVKLGVKVSNLPSIPEEGGENLSQDQFQLTNSLEQTPPAGDQNAPPAGGVNNSPVS